MNRIAQPGSGSKRPWIWDVLILAGCAIWLLREWVVMPVEITGKSMLPTFQSGQIALVNKAAYVLGAPRRGEIVAVRTKRELIVKRIVGLPGEEIAIRNGRVYVNGNSLDEPYVQIKDDDTVNAGRLGGAKYMVIGDNRPGTAMAVINENRIVGRVIPLRWSVSNAASKDN